ncbi:hypothetical protein [Roseiconus lacunae]|uniref:BON domain-containing protein n=1 Tax=Roseiconus lacunae TaxID=2605694 RepID=A0ABT7PHN0_9BACT|nr:hypothetical protein [Roseiconus lacunae]MDM4015997.1 hypothetical protein [Roseiconus lacunae]
MKSALAIFATLVCLSILLRAVGCFTSLDEREAAETLQETVHAYALEVDREIGDDALSVNVYGDRLRVTVADGFDQDRIDTLSRLWDPHKSDAVEIEGADVQTLDGTKVGEF